MRIEIMDGDTVTNVILASEEFAEQQHPGKWRLAEVQDVPAEPINPVPQSVTRRQGLQALRMVGITKAQIQGIIDLMPEGINKDLAQIEWDDAQVFERNRGIVSQMGYALGFTEEQLDKLFITAGSLP